MIARLAETVDRRRPPGPRALFAALDPRFDPAIAMKLQQLLPDRLAGQPERIGEMGDGRRPLLLQGGQNGAPAVRQLVDGENRVASSFALRSLAGKKFRKLYFA